MIGPGRPPEPEKKRARVAGSSGVDYSKTASAAAPIDGGASGVPAPENRSAAFDSFMRMQLGQEGRTIEDRINDKNRPTWDQYKKDNEDRLNLDGAEQKKMQAYRAQLDAERNAKLKERTKTQHSLKDSDASSDSDDDRKKRKKEKKRLKKEAKKLLKKEKKKKKSKKRSRSDSSSS
mmetsp:Transcript_19723/g.58701  ORF Transcript_19723/g.58701 Transcript_19723/m.58701 type:complete len:177 (-) Transcript_19723:23-553(-)